MTKPAIDASSATDVLDAYRARQLSPVEVVDDVLARITRHDPAINAFCALDPEGARTAARASAERWRRGAPAGVLDGLPATIKDNIDVAGLPTRRGSLVASDRPVAADAPLTARLREAGAIIVGKTTLPDHGWKGVTDSPLYGITRNPWKLARTPGGSSGGAAAAAALGLGYLHAGTDAAGSIRIPAAFTGVVGLKPTFGRVPAHPISVMGFLAHLGPLTRTIADAALMYAVIAQPDGRDVTANVEVAADPRPGLEDGVAGLRVAWSPRLGFVGRLDPEVERLTQAAVAALAGMGAEVEEADPGFDDPIDVLMTLWRAGANLALRPYDAAQRTRVDPGLVAVAEEGEAVSGADFVDTFLYARNALAERMARFHERFDLLATPTLPLPAFEAGRNTPADGSYGDDWTRWTPFTYPFNITGQPAISVPVGLTEEGLPVGLQIVGPRGADALVLRAGRAVEQAVAMPRLTTPRE